jgi:putative heme transporter
VTEPPAMIDENTGATSTRVRSIVFRIVLVVAALGGSFWLLANVFDDLDPAEIRSAVASLDDAELLSLGAMWLLWIGAQGLLTASLVPGLAVRHGVVAFLGPAAITSVVPGPSDLPIRYQMLSSWGRSPGEAMLAVTAGGVFSIGVKLVLPVIAALGLVISDVPITGTLRTVVVISLVVGLGLAILAVVLGSERRTEQAGRLIAPVFSWVLRLLRKPEPADLPARMVAARAGAVQTLNDRWLIASWATVLTAGTKLALLLMALRFVGVDDDTLPWTQVFVVYALVQGLTVLPITAGDAGVSELAYIGLLTAAAGDEWVNQITAAVLIFRLMTWLLIVPVGLGVLGWWRHQVGRSPASSSSTPDPAPRPD